MDLDFDWAACDAKKVEKHEPAPMKDKQGKPAQAKVAMRKPSQSLKRGPPVKKATLKKPAASAKTATPKTAKVEKASKKPSASAQKIQTLG